MHLPKAALLESCEKRLNNQHFLLLNNQVLNTEFQCEAVRASQILTSIVALTEAVFVTFEIRVGFRHPTSIFLC